MSARQRNSSDSGSEKAAIAGQSGVPGSSGKPSREEQFERQGVLHALEAGLGEAMPGLEVLDRNLVFDERVRADLAVVDPLGRLLLVLVAREDPQEALLETLDVLAYLRMNAILLMRHLASRQVDERLEPRVLLIDSSNDVLLAERLLPLSVAGVRIFGVRILRSSGSERSYLVPYGEELRRMEDPAIGVRSFLESLPEPLREVASDLSQRLGALDDQLLVGADEQSLIWRLNGMVIARMECSGDALRASIAPDHNSMMISESEHVDALLESALACLVEEYERCALEARDLPSGLGSLPSAATESLLSEEEIRAFHG